MSAIEWLETDVPDCRDFRIARAAGRTVTGALWLPDRLQRTAPLLLCGHGASGDRYQAPIPHLAKRFVSEGAAVLAIDGPVHGLRRVEPGGREAFAAEMRRASFVDDMIDDWHTALAALAESEGIGAGSMGYFGLSMGSMFGVPLVAARDDIGVACLGLLGTDGAAAGMADRLRADAARIRQPVLFLMQLEDELFPRSGYLDLFDCFASDDKRLHANPGLHPEIPAEEVDAAFDFISRRLQGDVQRRVVNPLAE